MKIMRWTIHALRFPKVINLCWVCDVKQIRRGPVSTATGRPGIGARSTSPHTAWYMAIESIKRPKHVMYIIYVYVWSVSNSIGINIWPPVPKP